MKGFSRIGGKRVIEQFRTSDKVSPICSFQVLLGYYTPENPKNWWFVLIFPPFTRGYSLRFQLLVLGGVSGCFHVSKVQVEVGAIFLHLSHDYKRRSACRM